MLPEEQAPPGLAELFSQPEMGDEEPDEIDVEVDESDADLLRTAIEALQQAMSNESDDADSAALAKIVQELYKLTAGRQDAAMSAMGGRPKEMRALSRAYAS